jgi:glutamine synthetase
VKPKAVLAYCREKGIKSVDLRFVDLDGNWRHITFPLSALTESAFEEGFGHEIQLDPHSKLSPAHAILLPQSEANYLDPFTNQPTLVLLATIQDPLMREESSLDSRSVALRAVRFLESTLIGDGVSIRAAFPFRILRSEVREQTACPSSMRTESSTFLACGPLDRDFLLRCEIADLASESGLTIHRHVSGASESSEMVLKPAGLVESCDDVMMVRYLIGQSSTIFGCQCNGRFSSKPNLCWSVQPIVG